jgi:hypothetical protein
MPDQHVAFTEEELAQLDRVRRQQGLDTVQQAAEWLAKTRLRRQARNMTGRGRSLYLTGREEK